MNRLYRYILAVAAIAAAASCAENIAPENPAADTEVLPENLEIMQFATSVDDPIPNPESQPAASVATRTTYASRKVYWEEADKISVFSIGETETVKTEFGVKALSDDRLTATFEGLADSQASAFCAVYPHHDYNAYENGTLTVNIPSEQTAVAEGFALGANVSVAYSANDGDVSLKFRNVTTLLCIKFADANDAANTQSITFKAKKSDTEYWGLSGQAQLTLDEEYVPVVEVEGSEQQVTLLAPADGFVKDAIYYVPVYAVGECAGFEVTFTDLNGDDYTKTKNVPGSLDRNWLFNFGSIPNPYPSVELPDELTITIDFTSGWPFKEPLSDTMNEIGEEYTYTHTYIHNGVEYSQDVAFVISTRGAGTYSYVSQNDGNDGYLQMPDAEATSNRYGAISVPAIRGMYLASIRIDLTKRVLLGKGGFTAWTYVTDSSANTTSRHISTFTAPFVRTNDATFNILGTEASGVRDWSLGMRNASVKIYSLTFRYTKAEPISQ